MARLLLLFVLLISVVASQSSDPVVRVTNGLLSGKWEISTNGRSYAAFKGIPYARPPVGKYRFREPQSMKPWSGVWDASTYLPHCIQYDPYEGGILGSENCLFLNVFTPKLTAGASLPVVVFIHGGAFMYGGTSVYDPSNLMDRDLIVVTLQYRVGPLGFLSTGDEVIPGNAGLKDQSFALSWVRQNIMMFGGNPDSVTLSGCSAGGASVHYHYLSSMSRGKFARGIAFSGSAFASWTHAVKPVQKARTLASIVGCQTTSSREIADCLRLRPAETIVKAQIQMLDWKVHMFTPFTPTVESANTRDPFLTQYPFELAAKGAMAPVPLLTSVTSEEGLYPAASYLADPQLLLELEERWNQLSSNIFEYNDTLPAAQRELVADKIRQRYLGGKPVGLNTFAQLVQALSDRLFVADVGRMAEIHAKSGQPVYLYRYSFRGEKSLSILSAKNDNNYGVSHADDVFHIFKYPGLVSTRADDVKMTNILCDMVYSFASNGIPRISNAQWTPVQPFSPELQYLEISSPEHIQMGSSADLGHRSFWSSLGFNENENYNSYVKDEL